MNQHQLSLIPDVVEDDAGNIRELKKELLEVSARVIDSAGKLALNHRKKEFEFLFAIYNHFIAPDYKPEKMTCSYCRQKVLNFFKFYVNAKTA